MSVDIHSGPIDTRVPHARVPESVPPDDPGRAYWEAIHGAHGYDDVFSVSEDACFRERIEDLIAWRSGDGVGSVLVPGCGSRTFIERGLAARFPTARVTATDFPGVVEIAARRCDHPRIDHRAADTRALDADTQADVAVVVNSIIAAEDDENLAMLHSVRRALRPGGLLVGLFPTVYATLDWTHMDPAQRWRRELIDLDEDTVYEQMQDQRQKFYTPLALRSLLRQAGWTDVGVELFFFDCPWMLDECGRVYGLRDETLPQYELLVTARA